MHGDDGGVFCSVEAGAHRPLTRVAAGDDVDDVREAPLAHEGERTVERCRRGDEHHAVDGVARLERAERPGEERASHERGEHLVGAAHAFAAPCGDDDAVCGAVDHLGC